MNILDGNFRKCGLFSVLSFGCNMDFFLNYPSNFWFFFMNLLLFKFPCNLLNFLTFFQISEFPDKISKCSTKFSRYMVSSKLLQIFQISKLLSGFPNFVQDFQSSLRIFPNFPPNLAKYLVRPFFGFLPNSSGWSSDLLRIFFFSKLFPVFSESYFWICWPNLILTRVPPNFLANFFLSKISEFLQKKV